MTELTLIKLMGALDISLLENNYLESDIKKTPKFKPSKVLSHFGGLKEGSEFIIQDSLQESIDATTYEQECLLEDKNKPEISEKIEVKVEAVKKKISYVWAVVTGIATMFIVAFGIILILLNKKSKSRIFRTIGRTKRIRSTV